MMSYLHKELTGKIIGCAMAVHNEIGHGLREKTYERGLCVEFECQKILYSQQTCYDVVYKNKKIDTYIPDLIVGDKIIVETKVVETITDEHLGQVLNYLRITGLKVGLIINFKHQKLQFKRVVLETAE